MKIFQNLRRQAGKQLPHVRIEALHLTGPGRLRRDESHLLFESDGRAEFRIDASTIQEVVSYGELEVTPAAMQLLSGQGIVVSWLNSRGTILLGRLAVDSRQHLLRRLKQFAAWEDRDWQLFMARELVMAKLTATQSALRHYQRQGRIKPADALKQFDVLTERCQKADDVNQVRGFEGQGARLWYQLFPEMLVRGWTFSGRNRRPPRDPVNAILSFGYMYVYRRVAARVAAAGLEAGLGALHEFRPGRLSLACDLMEPLRIPMVDRLVIALCNQGMIKASDFETLDSGACYLRKQQLGAIIGRLEQHWHQGHFQQQLEERLTSWIESFEERVSAETSRATSYLKKRMIEGSGKELGHDI